MGLAAFGRGGHYAGMLGSPKSNFEPQTMNKISSTKLQTVTKNTTNHLISRREERPATARWTEK